MRRVSASADHRSKSPSVEARKSKVPLLGDNRWRDSSNGTVAIVWAGRDWFPGGPYNHSGRGSIPRRSTFV
jgi:hypothetical protein